MVTFADLEAANPTIRQQYAEWASLRSRQGEDPGDYQAFRQHLLAIGAPDPGENVIADFPTPGIGRVAADGIIQKPEVTTYQYGTHVLAGPAGTTLYALRSEIEGLLDEHVGQYVRVVGLKVPGYPVDGGPELLNVVRIDDVAAF